MHVSRLIGDAYWATGICLHSLAQVWPVQRKTRPWTPTMKGDKPLKTTQRNCTTITPHWLYSTRWGANWVVLHACLWNSTLALFVLTWTESRRVRLFSITLERKWIALKTNQVNPTSALRLLHLHYCTRRLRCTLLHGETADPCGTGLV